MKLLNRKCTVVGLLWCLALSQMAGASQATLDEVREVARGWIATISTIKGGWGGARMADVKEVRELKRGNRVVGYYCAVQPTGYVVVSQQRELPPIQAFSVTGSLPPELDQGLMGMIKGGLEKRLVRLEHRLGPLEQARAEQFRQVLKTDYSTNWIILRQAAETSPAPAAARSGPPSDVSYDGGCVLLSSYWRQGDPYNTQCPADDGCSHAAVGCVPLAGAQIMRYWCWPPWGQGWPYNVSAYDWVNMEDAVFAGQSSTEAIDAVARLCHEVGLAADVSYGCEETTGYLWWPLGRAMDEAFTDVMRYHVSDHSWYPTFEAMKAELERNQPVQYSIPTAWLGGHSFVVDGWMEIPTPASRWLHVNYGRGAGAEHNLTWVNADEDMPERDDPSTEPDLRLDEIRPDCSLGATVTLTYGKSALPYRYFNVDATAIDAIFSPGQFLQFLPTVRLIAPPSLLGLTFSGSASDPTRLYTSGDYSKGIAIHNGAVKVRNNGAISLVPLVPPRYFEQDLYNGTVLLNWERPPGRATTVIVERKIYTAQDWTTFATLPSTITSCSDSTAQTNLTYDYRLRSGGNGGVSEPTRFYRVTVK